MIIKKRDRIEIGREGIEKEKNVIEMIFRIGLSKEERGKMRVEIGEEGNIENVKRMEIGKERNILKEDKELMI